MAYRAAYNINEPIVGAGGARQVAALGGVYSLVAADLATSNTVGLFKVPKGFTVTGILGKVDDLDTNGSPALLFTLGDSGAAARFLASSNAGQSGAVLGALPVAGIGYTFTADTEILMTVATGAATAAAGTITIFLLGYFDRG
jgi:hypothetical protein